MISKCTLQAMCLFTFDIDKKSVKTVDAHTVSILSHFTTLYPLKHSGILPYNIQLITSMLALYCNNDSVVYKTQKIAIILI